MIQAGPFLTQSEWLAWRRTGIGGSDAAAICGLSSFKRPIDIFMDKLELSENSDNEAMLWGRRLEPLVAKRFEELSGLKTVGNLFLQSSTLPFMLASVDRGIEGQSSGLEIKTAGGFSRKEWGIAGTDQIPHDYNIQCQHTMSVAEWERMHVAVLLGGNDFRYFLVHRNEKLIKDLIEVETRFWEKVQQREAPEETDPKKVQDYIKAMWPESVEETKIATEGIDKTIALYVASNINLETAEKETLALRNKITLFMEDAAILEGQGYKITYRAAAGRRSINTDGLIAECKIPSEIVEKHTTIGKPSRRFLVKQEKEEKTNG